MSNIGIFLSSLFGECTVSVGNYYIVSMGKIRTMTSPNYTMTMCLKIPF